MELLRSSRRLPAAPVILFREVDCTDPLPQSEIWFPDSRTFEKTVPTEVTYYFDNFDEFTAQPYVAEVPEVDFLGYTDPRDKDAIFQAFYFFGRQLAAGDVEFMDAHRIPVWKFIDALLRVESDGRESLTTLFERRDKAKAEGYIWTPYFEHHGLRIKMGKHQPQVWEPLPLYPYPHVEPPPYLPVEGVVADVKEEEDAAAEEDEAVIVDGPPPYEEAVTTRLSEKPTATSLEIVEENGEDEDSEDEGSEDEYSEDETATVEEGEPAETEEVERGEPMVAEKGATSVTNDDSDAGYDAESWSEKGAPFSRTGKWLRRIGNAILEW
ncbi:hypothetical protein GGR56DRAFT_677240 [Xylariaceae sp. FL0804]|nr:hypothetical protein GGR56DRAFT_677240 [Xylariaceae sp. FL0804]